MIKKLLAILAACAFLGGIGASSALASSAAPPPVRGVVPATSYGPYVFCAEQSQNQCQETHGVYSQNTLQTINTGTAEFLMTAAGSLNGEAAYVLSDAHGNCIKENNSDQVVVANGACSTSDNSERWGYYGTLSDAFFVNAAHGNYMSTTNLNNGDKVWGGPITNYYHWFLS